jgi:ribosomal-protein-alanine N-acetyltransferase
MSVTTRKAKIDDLEALYGIEKECFTLEAFSKNQIALLLRNPSTISLLAQMDSRVVGFIIALIYEEEKRKVGHIITLDVAVKARKRGVGLKLLNDLERIFRSQKVQVCYLEVRVDNKAALELYTKLGYVRTKLLKNFYPDGDGVRMKKLLQ